MQPAQSVGNGDSGYVLGSDDAAVAASEDFDAPLIASDEDWLGAAPARRASDRAVNMESHVGASVEEATHRWAELHEGGDKLLGALQLERTRHRGVEHEAKT